MPTPTLLELIAKLEKASGPDRELDYLIADAFKWRQSIIPSFTLSLDAALALVPEGEEWSVTSLYDRYGATCANFAADFKGTTGPVALCIAATKALRARTAIETGGE